MTTKEDIIAALERYIDENRWWKRLFSPRRWYYHHVHVVERTLEAIKKERPWTDDFYSEHAALKGLLAKKRYPHDKTMGSFPLLRSFNVYGDALVNNIFTIIKKATDKIEAGPTPSWGIPDKCYYGEKNNTIVISQYENFEKLKELVTLSRDKDFIRSLLERFEKSAEYLDALAQILCDHAIGRTYNEHTRYYGTFGNGMDTLHKRQVGTVDYNHPEAGQAILDHIVSFDNPWLKFRVLARANELKALHIQPPTELVKSVAPREVLKFTYDKGAEHDAFMKRFNTMWEQVIDTCLQYEDTPPPIVMKNFSPSGAMIACRAAQQEPLPVAASSSYTPASVPNGKRILRLLESELESKERQYQSHQYRDGVISYLQRCSDDDTLLEQVGHLLIREQQTVPPPFISQANKDRITYIIERLPERDQIRLCCGINRDANIPRNTIIPGNQTLCENTFTHWKNSPLRNVYHAQFVTSILANTSYSSWKDFLLNNEAFLKQYVTSGLIKETSFINIPENSTAILGAMFEKIQQGAFNKESSEFITSLFNLHLRTSLFELFANNDQGMKNLLNMLKQLPQNTQKTILEKGRAPQRAIDIGLASNLSSLFYKLWTQDLGMTVTATASAAPATSQKRFYPINSQTPLPSSSGPPDSPRIGKTKGDSVESSPKPPL